MCRMKAGKGKGLHIAFDTPTGHACSASSVNHAPGSIELTPFTLAASSRAAHDMSALVTADMQMLERSACAGRLLQMKHTVWLPACTANSVMRSEIATTRALLT